jgi:hypothetical protein
MMGRTQSLGRGAAGAACVVALVAASLAGCNNGNPYEAVPEERAMYPRLDKPIRYTDPCEIEISTPPLQLRKPHIAIGQGFPYSSNPATSGQHYPIWASFSVQPIAVPPGFYVHDLEHGAIVLFYRCAVGDTCADLRDPLIALMDSQPEDPICAAYDTRSRMLVTPEPDLPTEYAAAAWGWLYEADCYDQKTLQQFIDDRYGKGPEPELCDPGIGASPSDRPGVDGGADADIANGL